MEPSNTSGGRYLKKQLHYKHCSYPGSNLSHFIHVEYVFTCFFSREANLELWRKVLIFSMKICHMYNLVIQFVWNASNLYCFPPIYRECLLFTDKIISGCFCRIYNLTTFMSVSLIIDIYVLVIRITLKHEVVEIVVPF